MRPKFVYALSVTRARYQVSVYRTIGPLVLSVKDSIHFTFSFPLDKGLNANTCDVLFLHSIGGK